MQLGVKILPTLPFTRTILSAASGGHWRRKESKSLVILLPPATDTEIWGTTDLGKWCSHSSALCDREPDSRTTMWSKLGALNHPGFQFALYHLLAGCPQQVTQHLQASAFCSVIIAPPSQSWEEKMHVKYLPQCLGTRKVSSTYYLLYCKQWVIFLAFLLSRSEM